MVNQFSPNFSLIVSYYSSDLQLLSSLHLTWVMQAALLSTVSFLPWCWLMYTVMSMETDWTQGIFLVCNVTAICSGARPPRWQSWQRGGQLDIAMKALGTVWFGRMGDGIIWDWHALRTVFSRGLHWKQVERSHCIFISQESTFCDSEWWGAGKYVQWACNDRLIVWRLVVLPCTRTRTERGGFEFCRPARHRSSRIFVGWPSVGLSILFPADCLSNYVPVPSNGEFYEVSCILMGLIVSVFAHYSYSILPGSLMKLNINCQIASLEYIVFSIISPHFLLLHKISRLWW